MPARKFDNLGVLFELCRTLDLQLLIAAPEVAHRQDRALDDGAQVVLVPAAWPAARANTAWRAPS